MTPDCDGGSLKVVFTVRGPKPDDRVEKRFIVESEEDLIRLTRLFEGWINFQGVPVLEAKDRAKKSVVMRLADSSRVAPFQVKIGASASGGIKRGEGSPICTPERTQMFFKRVNVSKSRNLFKNFIQRDEEDDSPYNPESSQKGQPPEKHTSLCDSHIEPIDFAKILEEAKSKLGITNWQRTESAKKREQRRKEEMEAKIASKISTIKKHFVDSDDESESDEQNGSFQVLKQTKTTQPSSRIVILPQKKTVQPKSPAESSENLSSLKKRLTLRVKPLKPDLPSRASPTGPLAPISLKEFSSPKNVLSDAFRKRMISFQNSLSKDRNCSFTPNDCSNVTEKSPTALRGHTSANTGQSLLKKPIVSRNLTRKLFNIKDMPGSPNITKTELS